jgi:hypothetical protein
VSSIDQSSLAYLAEFSLARAFAAFDSILSPVSFLVPVCDKTEAASDVWILDAEGTARVLAAKDAMVLLDFFLLAIIMICNVK